MWQVAWGLWASRRQATSPLCLLPWPVSSSVLDLSGGQQARRHWGTVSQVAKARQGPTPTGGPGSRVRLALLCWAELGRVDRLDPSE